MMFSLRQYVKQGFLKAVGQRPAYQIMQESAKWLDKGVLEESDLEEIQNALAAAGQITGDVMNQ